MTDFTAGAWITGSRSRHSRLDDHSGMQPDDSVVLSAPIGKYGEGMAVSLVFADIVARIVALEGGSHRVSVFSAGAFVQPCVRAGAVISRSAITGSSTADAVLTPGGRVSLAAMITRPVPSSASADAWIVWPVC